jgi:hemerythrin-like domain-containing protein
VEVKLRQLIFGAFSLSSRKHAALASRSICASLNFSMLVPFFCPQLDVLFRRFAGTPPKTKAGMFLAKTSFAETSIKGEAMPHAIEMLLEDHHKVKNLFEEFKHAEEKKAKEQIVENTLRELEVHAALEEEIFYPAAEKQVDEKESIDEAREEHHVVKLLIGELRKMTAGEERYDAKYTVLAESVKHHIEEEESELFPKLEGKLDVEELGAEMETRKQELQQQPHKRTRARGSQSKTQNGRRKRRQTSQTARARKTGKKRARTRKSA